MNTRMKFKRIIMCISVIVCLLSSCIPVYASSRDEAKSKKERLANDSINKQEAALLNNIASKSGINFDFAFKKIAFYTGSGGGARTSKENFLPICRALVTDDEYDSTSYFIPHIYIFDKEEKEKANGYDAVIVFGSVKQYPSRKALIRRLHRFKFHK